MSTTQELYIQSLLAQAAYANLASGPIDNTQSLRADAGMAAKQAADFASKWTVVDQYNDTSGISATVFQEKATGTKYLVIRGTQPTDIGDINADYILAHGFPSFLNPQFIRLSSVISDWLSTGVLSNNFTVTGHSLGGYLASAVGSFFHANTTHVYTYNGPGLGGVSGNVIDTFRAVGRVEQRETQQNRQYWVSFHSTQPTETECRLVGWARFSSVCRAEHRSF